MGNMILIKDRHKFVIDVINVIFILGNMILIKDRHFFRIFMILTFSPGKYDTYKGSTLKTFLNDSIFSSKGKYDTYKGSTLILVYIVFNSPPKGNMILIKD